jgi:molecular chaperone HtpG
MERYQNRFRIRNAFWRQVYEKSAAFVLYPTVDDKFYTLEELKENLKEKQTDKDGKLVVLYAGNKDAQHYIEIAQEKGYEVLLLDSPIIRTWFKKLKGITKSWLLFVSIQIILIT